MNGHGVEAVSAEMAADGDDDDTTSDSDDEHISPEETPTWWAFRYVQRASLRDDRHCESAEAITTGLNNLNSSVDRSCCCYIQPSILEV